MTDATRDTPTTDYLTVPQAAEYLNLGENTLRRLIDAGTLPVHRYGRAVRVHRTALDDLARATLSKPTPGRTGRRG